MDETVVKAPKEKPEMNELEKFAEGLIRRCVGPSVEIIWSDETLPGTPDFTVPKLKLAIFVDGEFWHPGKRQRMRRVAIKFLAEGDDKKADFWAEKASRNEKHDKNVNKVLKSPEWGWKVVRLKEERLNGVDPLGYVSKSIGLALFRAAANPPTPKPRSPKITQKGSHNQAEPSVAEAPQSKDVQNRAVETVASGFGEAKQPIAPGVENGQDAGHDLADVKK